MKERIPNRIGRSINRNWQKVRFICDWDIKNGLRSGETKLGVMEANKIRIMDRELEELPHRVKGGSYMELGCLGLGLGAIGYGL